MKLNKIVAPLVLILITAQASAWPFKKPGVAPAAGTPTATAEDSIEKRPCNFSAPGATIPIPSSANQTVGSIEKEHSAALAAHPKPRIACLKELSPAKFSTMLLGTHIGSKCDPVTGKCRAGLLPNNPVAVPEK